LHERRALVGSKAMNLSILGLGTALPPYRFDRETAVRVAQILCLDPQKAPLMRVLYRQSGIDSRQLVHGEDVVRDVIDGTRHSQSVFLPSGRVDDRGPTTSQRLHQYAEQAPLLALRGCRQALDQAGLPASELTHLITVSCTGFHAPGVDISLIEGLELSPEIERTHIGFMGCHGSLNALRVANALTGANPSARVLICAVELCSLHFHYGSEQAGLVANALFADGAAALVCGSSKPAPANAWQVTANGARLFPDSADAMTWNIGDHGFEMTLSARVPNLIETYLRPWLEDWLQRHDLSLADIGSWAVHPGGPRVLKSVAKALGLGDDAMATSREVLQQYGNMSSPTVLFIIDRLIKGQAPRPCVALGFGPGLAAEVALLR
jgi:predicted naringenin-chalcone synthase